MIDFSKIHAFQSGQRYSFEELMCQLARRETFPVGSEFRRVEGAGGDGGVEAYWKKPNGKKTGYQAKYFLRCGDIDWTQIDKSVRQAINTHSDLERYVVAIPCDLTDKSGTKRRGQTGWQHWESRVKKWTAEANGVGIADISFEPWTQSELVDRLSRPDAVGMREYWFGETELSANWFKGNITEAVASLDERFHPEDHVDVRIQRLFSVLARGKEFISELTSSLASIERNGLLSCDLSALSKHPDPRIFSEIGIAHSALLKLLHEFAQPLTADWDTSKWAKLAKKLIDALAELTSWYWEHQATLKEPSSEKNELASRIGEASGLSQAASEFRALVLSRYLLAEKSRFAIVKGVAGSGKSHLLGRQASDAINHGNPAVLVLGQRLNDEEPWAQLAKHLHLAGQTSEQILGALDAAGEVAGVRALILIDAINEGPGSRYWRSHLQAVVTRISAYKHIACVVSCRSEYFELAVPEGLASRAQIFEISGFETANEQLNAARVYLDRRGIARPSTPWLAPEFVNPLFLRSVCIALERDGRSEFPVGLSGTRKILDYYLQSLGRNISHRESSIISLGSNFENAVQALAIKMSEERQDFLTLETASEAVSKAFGSKRSTTENDWLSVLLANGLLRLDPSPAAGVDHPNEGSIVRFIFQRFQDFLLADALLVTVKDAGGLFGAGGKLQFCINGDTIAWEWRGVLEALASILPEKYGVELVDSLPGGFKVWWKDFSTKEAFAESVKWRDRSAFNDRSLELLNELRYSYPHLMELILQVAVSADHPWNAEFIHSNLEHRKLPDRDAFWTVWLNDQTSDEDSTVGILIEWCLSGQMPSTKSENQTLAGLTLCWFCTSSNRSIRDRATKALTALFIANKEIFPKLLERFRDIDDLYVLERLLAAAFGACCRDPQPQRLATYSMAVFDGVFAGGKVPLGLLMRDYAYGIVELASYHSNLPPSVNLALCRPPYKSKKIRFSITDAKLEQLAKEAGGTEILRSAANQMGDFGDYEIGSRAKHFLSVPLSRKVSLTMEQRLRAFEDTVVGTDKSRIRAFEKLRKNANPYTYGIIAPYWEAQKKATKLETQQWQAAVNRAEQEFLQLVTETEAQRFNAEVAPSLYERSKSKTGKAPELSLSNVRKWVAKRAYDYGWNSERFQRDQSKSGQFSRDRPLVERIGKKYQWLALDELLCRLADNNWLAGEYGQLPRPYANPIDLGFARDIDPTIIENKESVAQSGETHVAWVIEPAIKLDNISEEELTAWPFHEDPGTKLQALPIRTDDHGRRWVVLYEHQSKTIKYLGAQRGEHGLRQQEFRFLKSIIVRTSEAAEISAKLQAAKQIDLFHWGVSDMTDSAFLHEAPWRNTWPQDEWRYDNWDMPNGIGLKITLSGYHWESHLDASLPDGYSRHLPAPWLAKALGLRPINPADGSWVDSHNEIVFREFVGEEGGLACLIREDKLEPLLSDDLCIFSLLVAERTAWPNGSNLKAAWRRSEGVCWHDGKTNNAVNWRRDTRNGQSAEDVD